MSRSGSQSNAMSMTSKLGLCLGHLRLPATVGTSIISGMVEVIHWGEQAVQP